MRRPVPIAASLALCCAALACSGQPEAAGVEMAITEANVYENERYWPSIVALTEEWTPPGEANPLQAQWRGVLVRVEPDGEVRVDLGRHGRHGVPMRVTDLVQRANEILEGSRAKLAPNFVLRVGNNLVDASSRPIRAHRLVEIAGASGYLCVFADPRAGDLTELVGGLAGLDGLNGVRTVLFPQSVGRHDLTFVHERLASLSWQVPFLYPRLSEGYTVSILGEPPRGPLALLLSPEGRVLHRAELGRSAALSELRKAIEGMRPPGTMAAEAEVEPREKDTAS